MEPDRDPHSSHRNPAAARIHELTERAEKAGYVLVRSASPLYEWRLLDAEYCENIFATTQLDEIERWFET